MRDAIEVCDESHLIPADFKSRLSLCPLKDGLIDINKIEVYFRRVRGWLWQAGETSSWWINQVRTRSVMNAWHQEAPREIR